MNEETAKGNRDPALLAALAAAGLSFLVWPLFYLLGMEERPAAAPVGYETYFQQANWWPFPFFFLAIAMGLRLTWYPLMRAWAHLAESGVLLGRDGPPSDEALRQLRSALSGQRRWALWAALLTTLAVNVIDWLPLYGVYFGDASLAEQVAAACLRPNASTAWLFAQAGNAPLCQIPESAFTGARIEQPLWQAVYNVILMAQQFALIFFAALAVYQILLHTLLFGLFERLAVARRWSLHLLLNCRSPLNEFGLERWNFALNNFYWASSPIMLAVFLSRAATPPELHLPGQALLAFAVPAALMAPMVATILVRQARLPAAWRSLEPKGPVPAEDYRRQQLWPLDRNWSSKLGIVLAFALAALSIGFEINQLMAI
ncbi:MAG: hypothetical protein AAFY02_08115 [Pseudomonadota bacterium]